MEAQSGGGGKDGGEVRRRQLISQMEKLNAQLEELRLADEQAGGDETTITSELHNLSYISSTILTFVSYF